MSTAASSFIKSIPILSSLILHVDLQSFFAENVKYSSSHLSKL